MEQKPPAKAPLAGARRAASAGPSMQAGVGERTVVVPLAELLKRGQKKSGSPPPNVKAVYAESTQLSLNPFMDQQTGLIKLPDRSALKGAAAAPASAAAPMVRGRVTPPKTDEQVLPPASTPQFKRPNSAVPRAAPPPAAKGGVTYPGHASQAQAQAQAQPQPQPQPQPQQSVLAAAAAELVRPAELPRQVVVFFSCKGGAGTTFLATNAAHNFSRRHVSTCLLDLDLQLGDALAALSLQPRATIAQGIELNNRGEVVGADIMPQHRSGLAVLSQVGSLEDLDKVTPDGIANLVQGLRRSFGTIFVDGVRDFSETALAVLDSADKVALVILQEVLAIRRGRWAFNILLKIGKDPRDIVVVVNRFMPEHNITLATLKQMFVGATLVTVGRDEPLVQQSLDRAMPLLDLSPQHVLTKHVSDMAAILSGQTSHELLPELREVAKITKEEPKGLLGDKLRFWKRP